MKLYADSTEIKRTRTERRGALGKEKGVKVRSTRTNMSERGMREEGCREQMRGSSLPFMGRRVARVSGVGTREMEEIRGNTARNWISRRGGLFCQGFRNEDKTQLLSRHRVVDGHRPYRDRVSWQTSSRPLASSLVCAEIGNLLVRDRHSRR